MRLELAKYPHDIPLVENTLAGFVTGHHWADYRSYAMLRSASERQFEIIGEALLQLARRDAVLASGVSEYPCIIAFRNILIDGYEEWTTTWCGTSSRHGCCCFGSG